MLDLTKYLKNFRKFRSKKKFINKKGTRVLITIWYSVVILSFFWNFFYIFDLFSHFYFLYFLFGLIITISAIILKDKTSIITSVILLIFIWYNLNKADVIINEDVSKSDIFYLNANYHINKPQKILEEIKKYSPDFVFIVELNEVLYSELEKSYENNVYHSQGVASLWFFTNQEILDYKIHKLTYPLLEIHTEKFTAFLVHPFPPMSHESYLNQKMHFQEIKELFNKNVNENKMIIWDFNSTFYSSVFKKYFWELYYKPIYSWGHKSILKMPIDYAIWNHDFFNTYGSTLKVSDHSPLIIRFKD